MYVEFKLKLRNNKHYFKVFIYDSHDDMVKAKQKLKGVEKGDSSIVAICCPFERYKIEKSTGGFKKRFIIGHLYFDAFNIGIEAATHEIVHAALHAERVVYGSSRASFGTNCGEKEERLADNIGYMTSQFVKECKGV